MAYSIELYFEPIFEQSLRALWNELAVSGVPSIVQKIGSRPHLSLIILDQCNEDHVDSLIDVGATGLHPFPITFPAFSIMPGGQHSVLLMPTVNQGLLDIQKNMYNLLAGNGYAVRLNYEPRNWLPHCSISKELSQKDALKTLEICLNTPIARETRVTDIGFIEFRPRKTIKTIYLRVGAECSNKGKMKIKTIDILEFKEEDRPETIALWKRCGLVVPQNDPNKDIDRKIKVNPELFLVGKLNGKIVASVMGGYEGHRGWINYLAVDPDCRLLGYGRLMMDEIERRLKSMGCPKINLQVRETNSAVIEFYEAIGFADDHVISLGKRLAK